MPFVATTSVTSNTVGTPSPSYNHADSVPITRGKLSDTRDIWAVGCMNVTITRSVP